MRKLRNRFYIAPSGTAIICGTAALILGINQWYDGYQEFQFVLCVCLGLVTIAQAVHIVLLDKRAYEIDSVQDASPVTREPEATTYRSNASRRWEYVQRQFADALARNGYELLSVGIGVDFSVPTLGEMSPNTIGWIHIQTALTTAPSAPGKTILPWDTLLARDYSRDTPDAVYYDGTRYFLLSFGRTLPRDMSPVELDPSAGTIVTYLGAADVGPLAE